MMAFNAEAPNSESRPERTVRGAPRPAIFLDGLLMRANSRILVIDGDERMLAAIRHLLVGARYDVAIAASGDDGLAELLGGHVDLVLCDGATAEKNHPSTLRGLKAIAPAVPLIVMGNGPADGGILSADIDDAGAALAVDARVIEKPFRGSNLVALIYDCLAHRSVSVH